MNNRDFYTRHFLVKWSLVKEQHRRLCRGGKLENIEKQISENDFVFIKGDPDNEFG